MTEYNGVKTKLSDSQLGKLKSLTKTVTWETLRVSINMIDNDETNFPHKLLLTHNYYKSL